MRRTYPSMIAFLGLLFLLTSACQTMTAPPPALPSGLEQLFEIKNNAEADGQYLKDHMEEPSEKTMGESIKEMIGASETPKKNLASGRVKYNDVYSSYNATIELIQRSLEIGRNPSDYAEDLEGQIEVVRKKQKRLARYVKKQFGTSRGIVDVIESKEAKVLVATVHKIWKARKKEIQKERQNAIDALEAEKMVRFADLY